MCAQFGKGQYVSRFAEISRRGFKEKIQTIVVTNLLAFPCLRLIEIRAEQIEQERGSTNSAAQTYNI